MSYEKQNFVKGQILKADHLNHMEDGIAAAAVGVQGPKGDKGEDAVFDITDDFYFTSNNKLALVKEVDAIKDNTKPITSGGVYNIVGNIESLLETI